MKSTPGIVISMLVFFVADSAPLGAIEELVVTAQKREQNIQDVSISRQRLQRRPGGVAGF